jgi:hypothetical protein
MAGLFAGYRSAHHPDTETRLPLATAYLKGEAGDEVAETTLRRRDRLFRFEMESSSLAGILVAPLSRACPGKRFILTIRDVYSWCDSWIDHNINQPADGSSPWSVLDRLRLHADDTPPTRFDEPLSTRGFPPLECYFRLWAEHNARVLEAVEPGRLLVVRTDEIAGRIPDLATWAGVPTGSLHADQSWLFRAPEKHNVLAELDASYVRETADRICGSLMREHFPGVVWREKG